jgi:hypothetical protein
MNVKIIGDVAELLRARLAPKLTESDLVSLTEEVVNIIKTQSEDKPLEDKVDKLKNSIDYIDYKCREIERSLRASDRHVKPRERLFRDRSRSPLRGASSMFAVHARTPTAIHPWFDSYFS